MKRLVAYPGRQAGFCQFIARGVGQADMIHHTQFHKINPLTGSAPEYQRWHAVFVCQGKYVIAAANQQGAKQASEVQVGRVGFVVVPLDGKMLGIEAESLQFAVDLGGHTDEFLPRKSVEGATASMFSGSAYAGAVGNGRCFH